jgi:photosystem II stability/assembly factor-like uncharacterized protein
MTGRRFGLACVAASLLVVGAACTSAGPRTHESEPREAEHEGFEGEEGEGAELEELLSGQPHPESIIEHLEGYESYFFGQRAAPAKAIPPGAFESALKEAKAIGRATPSVVSASSTWQSAGPQPVNSEDPTYQDPVVNNFGAGWGIDSGRVTAVAVDPSDDLTVYMGAADGGIWKTTDGGATWASLGDQLDTQTVGAIAIDPRNPSTLYVGTGEASTNSDAYFGLGVFKSTDAGASFTKIGGSTFDEKTVFKVVAPDAKGLVFVATNQGLYRSKNAGGSFSRVLAPGDTNTFGNFVSDIITLTPDGRNLLAAIGWRGGAPSNGLYRSQDGGTTWTRLSPKGFPPQARLGRMTLAQAPSQPKLLYAVVQDASYFNSGGPNGTVLNGVYRSMNGPPGSWQRVADSAELAADPGSAMDPDKIGPGFGPGVQAWYDQHIEVDPTNPNHVTLGLEELYESVDGGQEWDTIGRYWNFCFANPPWPESPWCNAGPGTEEHTLTTHPDQHDAAYTSTGDYFAGNDGGMFFQAGPDFDNDHWVNQNRTISTIQCYYGDIAADGTMLCGTQDNGTAKFTGGAEWPVVTGGDGGDVAIEPDNSQNMWAEYVGLTMFASGDGGVTWAVVPPPDDNPRFISPFEMDPLNSQHVVAGGQELWDTTLGIATTSDDWVQLLDLGAPRQATAISVRGGDVYAAWCGPCNPSSFTPGTPFAAGLVSNIGGTFHELAGAGLPNRYITSVLVDPADADHLWVTVSGFSRRWIPAAGIGHVFESTDGGESFTNISAGLPDIPANDIVSVGGDLVVATDVGVFVNEAGTWSEYGLGLPQVSVLDLALQPDGGLLMATTHGRGVWLLDVST